MAGFAILALVLVMSGFHAYLDWTRSQFMVGPVDPVLTTLVMKTNGGMDYAIVCVNKQYRFGGFVDFKSYLKLLTAIDVSKTEIHVCFEVDWSRSRAKVRLHVCFEVDWSRSRVKVRVWSSR